MSASAEASQLARLCAEPVSSGESVKALIRKASMRTGLRFSRMKAIWYSEARAIRAEEIDVLRMKVAVRKAQEDVGRIELREIIERLERIENVIRGLATAPRSLAD